MKWYLQLFWTCSYLQQSHRCHVPNNTPPLLAVADSEGNVTLHQFNLSEVGFCKDGRGFSLTVLFLETLVLDWPHIVCAL